MWGDVQQGATAKWKSLDIDDPKVRRPAFFSNAKIPTGVREVL
jgi:hypothetical protein